jgi:hypothetical protein
MGPDDAMWNAGVVGIDAADYALLDEVLHLNDELQAGTQFRLTEQFAFSACLMAFTQVRECYDVVHHYWRLEDRTRFRLHLSQILSDPELSTAEERFRIFAAA